MTQKTQISANKFMRCFWIFILTLFAFEMTISQIFLTTKNTKKSHKGHKYKTV